MTKIQQAWKRYRKAQQDVRVTRGIEQSYIEEREKAFEALMTLEKAAAKRDVNRMSKTFKKG